ncbi:hypothetical protein OIV83_003057 [Microbotryomycetes sp. JL201]|nr:hypothetical protein OIV83_003057 [Microbotryomycetes sp. JL201]
MSRTAKLFFGASALFGVAAIGGVHLIQQQERETMFAGVLRDEARMAAKRQQKLRELEFEDQARKRAYLETVQSVSTSSSPRPDVPAPATADGMDFGCKSCDKPAQ